MPDLFTVKPEPAERRDDEAVAIEILLGKTLRIGVVIAAVVIGLGVAVFLIRERGDISFDNALGRREAIVKLTPEALWSGLKAGSARSIILLGIFLLILTPIVRVAMTLLLFFRQRDWILAVCAGFVLTILVLGLAGIGI